MLSDEHIAATTADWKLSVISFTHAASIKRPKSKIQHDTLDQCCTNDEMLYDHKHTHMHFISHFAYPSDLATPCTNLIIRPIKSTVSQQPCNATVIIAVPHQGTVTVETSQAYWTCHLLEVAVEVLEAEALGVTLVCLMAVVALVEDSLEVNKGKYELELNVNQRVSILWTLGALTRG